MIAAPFRVVLDANVLFPFTLRDTLLRAAAKGYFQVYWSEQIFSTSIRMASWRWSGNKLRPFAIRRARWKKSCAV